MNPVRTRLVAAALGAGLVFATPIAAWAGPRQPVSTTSSQVPSDSNGRSIEDLRARWRDLSRPEATVWPAWNLGRERAREALASIFGP